MRLERLIYIHMKEEIIIMKESFKKFMSVKCVKVIHWFFTAHLLLRIT